ncbi:hypothetical protein CXB51_024328 [Gossypium anomalum]|uniref:GTD-binding domain-containing protein n=1 Tax=Gossypium anomalum TaxID=47600 RepID=A0A8J6CS70_9ROSI|nr:hypothetical protein CXB51_024328 [Gossypium anomalum]
MGRGGTSSANTGRISRWFSTALSSAFFEWLFIPNKKFAQKSELRTPYMLCSRLDNVFGKEKRKFYMDLVCNDHKLEISSLVYCHAHNKLLDVHGMCESYLFSFATMNKSNAETYRLLVGKLGDFDCGLEDYPSLGDHKLGCSTKNTPWMPREYVKTSIQTRSAVFPDTKVDLPLPVSVEHGHDEQNRSGDVSVLVQATHQRKNQPDPLSHVVYSELQIDSESESEVKNDAGSEEDGIIIQTHHLKQDLVDQHVQPESQTFTLSDNFASEKFMDPVSALKPSIFISQSESESAIIEPLGTIPAESTDLKQHGLEELNWEQASTKIEPSASSKLISIDDVPLSSMDKEASIDVSTEMNLSSVDKVSPLSNAGEIPNQWSEDSKLISLDFLSSSPIDNETPVEVPNESKNISVNNVSPSNVAASSVKESKESSVMETPEVEKISEAKCEEIHISAEQPLPIPESPVEENHVMNGNSIQAINSLDLSDAYKLAVGSKGRQLSGLLVEQWIGRDSSRLSEDLKVLLSQLSFRGMEQLMSDVSPRIAASPRIAVSPRISITGDDLKASDSSAFNGIEILSNEDGSIVSEIEGENVVDWLKRQVEHDRKLLSALYKELEEERNASAVATDQAMAMITRMQEEKATLQMEALQHLRMMEELAEYDMEALQNTNDHLAEKERDSRSRSRARVLQEEVSQ